MFGKRQDSASGSEAPALRLVPVRILTTAGWIVGKLRVSRDWHLLNFMNNASEFFLLEDVILEGRPKVIPLFTLHRAAIQFVVVESKQDTEPEGTERNHVEHAVQCLLENGTLYGRLSIMRSVRLSDYLSKHLGFVFVRDVHLQLRNPWEKRGIDHRESAVLLNPRAVIGVSESVEDE